MAVRRVSAREARARFGGLIKRVRMTNEAVVVERNGKPLAVVVSPDDYENLQRVRERAWAAIDALRERNADRDEEEVLADVTAEVRAVRRARHERATRR